MSAADGPIAITAIEAISPVGGTAEETWAAVQAEMSAFAEYPLLSCSPSDPAWEEPLPLYAAMVPAIDPSIRGSERFLQLGIASLGGLLGKSTLSRKDLSETGLLLALPSADEDTVNLGLDARLLPQLCKRMGLAPKTVGAVQQGRSGFFAQMGRAIEALQRNELDRCLVVGIDSYLVERRLERLDQQWRLKSERNVDGFIPGEAAAALLLEPLANTLARGEKPLAVIRGIGSGSEAEILSSEKASTGTGLSQALRNATLAKDPGARIQYAFCDFNGESYFAFELGLIMSRLAEVFTDDCQLAHPADCYGDVGAATGGLLLACAISRLGALGKGQTEALLWTSSEGSSRTAARIAAY